LIACTAAIAFRSMQGICLAEGDLAPAEEQEPSAPADRVEDARDRVHVHSLGRLAEEAEDDRAIGPMAAPRGAERAIELRPDGAHALEGAGAGERLGERPRGLHRADRVGRGGTDPDLEEVEDARRHVPAVPDL